MSTVGLSPSCPRHRPGGAGQAAPGRPLPPGPEQHRTPPTTSTASPRTSGIPPKSIWTSTAPWSSPACCLLTDHPEGAGFWWQLAAGAGNREVGYHLHHLHHLALGGHREARHWLHEVTHTILDSGAPDRHFLTCLEAVAHYVRKNGSAAPAPRAAWRQKATTWPHSPAGVPFASHAGAGHLRGRACASARAARSGRDAGAQSPRQPCSRRPARNARRRGRHLSPRASDEPSSGVIAVPPGAVTGARRTSPTTSGPLTATAGFPRRPKRYRARRRLTTSSPGKARIRSGSLAVPARGRAHVPRAARVVQPSAPVRGRPGPARQEMYMV